jgi:hypothetical protein
MVDFSQPQDPGFLNIREHGLHFLNKDWNGTIINDRPFLLHWNESLQEDGAYLNLFRVIYPSHGLVSYDKISSLPDLLSNDTFSWTPKGLNDSLYTLLLTTDSHTNLSWTFSPVWKPHFEVRHFS